MSGWYSSHNTDEVGPMFPTFVCIWVIIPSMISRAIPVRWDPCFCMIRWMEEILHQLIDGLFRGIHQWFPGSFVVHLNSIDRNEHLPTHEQAYSIIITFWREWPLLKTTETDECSLFKIWKHLRIPDTSDISCKPRIFRTRFEHA